MFQQGHKSRGYVFTVNNYTDEDIEYLDNFDCQYIIYGKEEAPTTGTKHLQGYVHFTNARSASSVRKLLKTYHIERRMGSIEQAVNYCKKEGNFKERGQLQITSMKNQWAEAITLAEKGQVEVIKEEFPRLYLQYRKTFLSMQKFDTKPLEGDLQNEWWYGPTGT